ncbi:MAG TPA: helix-turn-helix transcriptional regulator [Puia sp.]|uniref:helix-turn-helix domain-containing protein n=1 Tax=Puia sp. TaxID=2045100 RepID=UPI002C320D60|nr:helix-turn-helix transcriptional regulator [Puia sp.]HVU94371.1 helix-turn-helix transcriptional regulator [Puia sp.]
MITSLPIKDKSGGRAAITVTPFKPAIRCTEPHRHNGYFELIFLNAGEGSHIIDGRPYPVQPPVLFVVRRHQVHCWELTTPGQGYVLIIRKDFVDQLTDGRLRSLFASISEHSCLPLEQSRSVEPLWTALLDELPTSHEEVPELVEWILKALLGKLIALARPSVPPIRQSGSLYDQFLHLLDNGKTLKRTVQHYAHLLHTTPQNLNNACRKAVDLPATGILENSLATEAKRLLLYTNSTVAEISFSLDFKDPSHFVKYFKRITGQTPQAFRQS